MKIIVASNLFITFDENLKSTLIIGRHMKDEKDFIMLVQQRMIESELLFAGGK